jgi:hypothetical protein
MTTTLNRPDTVRAELESSLREFLDRTATPIVRVPTQVKRPKRPAKVS